MHRVTDVINSQNRAFFPPETVQQQARGASGVFKSDDSYRTGGQLDYGLEMSMLSPGFFRVKCSSM